MARWRGVTLTHPVKKWLFPQMVTFERPRREHPTRGTRRRTSPARSENEVGARSRASFISNGRADKGVPESTEPRWKQRRAGSRTMPA